MFGVFLEAALEISEAWLGSAEDSGRYSSVAWLSRKSAANLGFRVDSRAFYFESRPFYFNSGFSKWVTPEDKLNFSGS